MEAALKRHAEAYDTYLEQQNTMALTMPNTTAAATSKILKLCTIYLLHFYYKCLNVIYSFIN